MKGPKALLSLFKTMTIYEGPEGAAVTLSGPPISEMLPIYSLMASHPFCSFILRFSYIYILHIVISFSILSFCLSYVMNASMHSGIHIFIYSFLYSYLFISFTYSCHVFMNTSIPIAFSIFSLFHAYDIWNFIYLYRNTDVFTHHSCILVPLRIYVTQELESIQSDHPN